MFNTEFTSEEMDALRELLEREVTKMDVEIERTDTHEFKLKLRHRRDLLRSLVQKLSAVPAH